MEAIIEENRQTEEQDNRETDRTQALAAREKELNDRELKLLAGEELLKTTGA